MSETIPNKTEEQVSDPYEGLDNATLAAITEAQASINEGDSETKSLDLRSTVRGILENTGVEDAFKRTYNLNNMELKQFVEGAAQEQKGRQVTEVKSIIDAYDSNDSFADRRTAIREALSANGREDAFRTIYDMNNLELTKFVDDARREHQELTTPTQDEALVGAYDEYENQEGTPYDVDKGRVKDPEEAHSEANSIQHIREIGDYINKTPTTPEDQIRVEETRNQLEDVYRQVEETINPTETPSTIETPSAPETPEVAEVPRSATQPISPESTSNTLDIDALKARADKLEDELKDVREQIANLSSAETPSATETLETPEATRPLAQPSAQEPADPNSPGVLAYEKYKRKAARRAKVKKFFKDRYKRFKDWRKKPSIFKRIIKPWLIGERK